MTIEVDVLTGHSDVCKLPSRPRDTPGLRVYGVRWTGEYKLGRERNAPPQRLIHPMGSSTTTGRE